MKDKKGLARKIGDFLAGKGFYVVLFICTAVIGVSAWILLSTGTTTDELDTGNFPSSAEGDQEVMASPNGNIADAWVSEAIDGKAPVTPSAAKPSDNAVTSAAPTKDADSNKAASEDDGASEEAMAKPLDFVWPIIGDIAVVYSVDELVYNKTMSDWRTHDGIDIAGTLGTKIMAAADGTVVELREDDLLGTTVVIDHGNGLKSIYSNLAKTPVVKTGDNVAMGSVLGAIGDTALGETNDVSHLHFAMTLNDLPVDPSKYLPAK